MKKIALVIPSLSSGGAERVISVLANEWSKMNGYEVHLFILTNLPDVYQLEKNIFVHRIGFKAKKNNRLLKLYMIVKSMLLFRREVSRISPDFILGFLSHVNFFIILSLLFKSNRVFVSERNSPNLNKSIFFEWIRKFFYSFSTGIIVQSKTFKNFLEYNGYNAKIKVIPNPIQKLESINYSDTREKYILNVGRLVDQKDHRRLIDIFNLVVDRQKGWKLVIVGDGPLRKELLEYTKLLGLSNEVIFKGECKKIEDFYNTSQIFAFTSKYEGFPNALAEAMSCGLPCVSFDCVTGPSELISSSYNGFLVPEKENELFAERLLQLMSSYDLRLKLSSNSSKISSELDSSKIAKEYLNFCIENSK